MRNAFENSDQIQVIDLWHVSDPILENEMPVLDSMHELFGGIVVSGLIGSGFDDIAMFRHDRPFDFVSPYEPNAPIEPGAEILPFDAVRMMILAKIRHNFSLIERLSELTGDLLLQIESPPVWGHERNVSDWPAHHFRKTGSFGSRYLRRKVHRVHTEMVRSFCLDRNIDFVALPEEALDDEGFLRREYSKDPVHGTEEYGTLYACKILHRIAVMKGVYEA
jgi:hypothetical protein